MGGALRLERSEPRGDRPHAGRGVGQGGGVTLGPVEDPAFAQNAKGWGNSPEIEIPA